MTPASPAKPWLVSSYDPNQRPALSQLGPEQIKVEHSHPCRDKIIERIDSLNLSEILDLIAKVQADIQKFKPYSRDESGNYSVIWVDAACCSIGADKAILQLLKLRLKELGLPKTVNI